MTSTPAAFKSSQAKVLTVCWPCLRFNELLGSMTDKLHITWGYAYENDLKGTLKHLIDIAKDLRLGGPRLIWAG